MDPTTKATESEPGASVRTGWRAALGLAASRCRGIPAGVAGFVVQIELVDLAYEIDPEAEVALLLDEVKPAGHVDLSSSNQRPLVHNFIRA